MLDINQLRELVIVPSLQQIGLYSKPAELLLAGTALVESSLTYLAQVPHAVAKSMWMIEQPTYTDLRAYLLANKALAQKILDCLWMDGFPSSYNYLAGNLTAACIFARVKYYTIRQPIPIEPTAENLAEYWGIYYNTKNLDSDKQRFIKLYNQYVTP